MLTALLAEGNCAANIVVYSPGNLPESRKEGSLLLLNDAIW